MSVSNLILSVWDMHLINTPRALRFVKGTFDQRVWFGFSSYTISIYIIFWNYVMLKIIVDRRHPISTVIVLYDLWSVYVLRIDLYDLKWNIYVLGMLDHRGWIELLEKNSGRDGRPSGGHPCQLVCHKVFLSRNILDLETEKLFFEFSYFRQIR